MFGKHHRDKIKVSDPVIKDRYNQQQIVEQLNNAHAQKIKSKADFMVREIYLSNISNISFVVFFFLFALFLFLSFLVCFLLFSCYFHTLQEYGNIKKTKGEIAQCAISPFAYSRVFSSGSQKRKQLVYVRLKTSTDTRFKKVIKQD